MTLRRLYLLGAWIAVMAGVAVAQDDPWHDVVCQDGRFGFAFPAEPNVDVQTVDSQQGRVRATTYSLELNALVFTLGYYEFLELDLAAQDAANFGATMQGITVGSLGGRILTADRGR